MIKGILHLHITVAIIFLVFMVFKTILLLIDKTDLLANVREKTKIFDIVIGILILGSGGYLMFALGNFQGYIIGKVIVVLIAIPLGIIGLKRKVKSLAVISVLLFVYVYGVAATESLKFKKDRFELPEGELATDINRGESQDRVRAKHLYVNLCKDCHGAAGSAGVAGAYDLASSEKSIEENVEIIKKGPGTMPSFRGTLSDEDIRLLAEYILLFRDGKVINDRE
ncbi:MAG: c-type cytochrome [Cytophagaceae bacterium]